MPRNLISEETRQRVRELWNNGLTSGEISKELGITRNSVVGIIDRLRGKGFFVRIRGKGAFKVKKPRPLVIRPSRELPPVLGTPTDILGLKFRSCRFIVEEGDVKTTKYCNNRIYKQSFCNHHYSLCYVPIRAKKISLVPY